MKCCGADEDKVHPPKYVPVQQPESPGKLMRCLALRGWGETGQPKCPDVNITLPATVWDMALLQFNRGFHETQLARLLINQLCKTDEQSDILFYSDTAHC